MFLKQYQEGQQREAQARRGSPKELRATIQKYEAAQQLNLLARTLVHLTDHSLPSGLEASAARTELINRGCQE
ncbi:hypothetical protein CMI48_01495 [Candidatus Pacearchaeota archaeon]|nr:hypothetical protein [Candidatus Pacearchaeota archaeon]